MTATAARRAGWFDAACVALLAGWLLALVLGIWRHRFDYDEFEQLYAVWQVKIGSRPFYDFFECHPPFLWYPLALVLRACAHFASPLFGYRVVTVLGHLAFVLALGANVALSRARLPAQSDRRTFALAVLLFAGAAAVSAYLVEFRLDAWPNALLFFAIYRYRRQPDPPFRASFQVALLALAAIFCCPKLIALFGFYALGELAMRDDRRARLAGLAAGAGATVALALLGLAAARLNPIVAYRLGLDYHAILNAKAGFGHGLARAVLDQPALLALMVSSLIGWVLVMGRRIATQPFELAVLGFLLFQVTFVAFGYAQYVAPWFLLGVVFFPYLDLALRSRLASHGVFLAAVLLCAAVNVTQDLRALAGADETAHALAFDSWARARVAPDATVAGAFSRVPIFRQNAFPVVVYSIAPSGYSTTEILQAMRVAPFDRLTTDAALDQALDAARPALISEGGILSPGQQAALTRYLTRHAGAYQRVESPADPVYLRVP